MNQPIKPLSIRSLLLGLCLASSSAKGIGEAELYEALSLAKAATAQKYQNKLRVSDYKEQLEHTPELHKIIASFSDIHSSKTTIKKPIGVAIGLMKSLYALTERDMSDPLLNPLSNRELHEFMRIMQEVIELDQPEQEEYLMLHYGYWN